MVLSIASILLGASSGIVYLGVIGLVPLMLVLGLAGLISPNVVRAAGKYGGHLPVHYKIMGWGVIGAAFHLMLLLGIGLFVAGFEPDFPGRRNQLPGLTRAQTAQVLERIRASHANSPDADVVRNVSFPVFALREPDAAIRAERVLGEVPGYVAGSFRISAEGTKAFFQYKGDKEMANQYALLLPGPTGVYITFTPEFEE